MAAGLLDKLAPVGGLLIKAKDAAGQAINEDRIRLAVTGLSQAGKTIFITSLIQNLLSLAQGADTLPRLSKTLNHNGFSRLRGVRLLPSGVSVLPEFAFPEKLAGLAQSAPAWPERTDFVSQISLELQLDRGGMANRVLGPRRVILDIIDYPGEWLLDLPLRSQSFATWSATTLERLRKPPRDAAFAEFLQFLKTVRADDKADSDVARQGHALYKQGLKTCQDQYKLRYLQPGRFLCRGPGNDAPFLWFFPIHGATEKPRPGALTELLAKRFEAYKTEITATFFDPFFQRFSRQVLLVDVLGALAGGNGAFEDTIEAIQGIAKSLRYGGGLFNKLAGKPKIERVVFVATKADHVPSMQQDNLRNLLRAVIDSAEAGQGGTGAQVAYDIVASLRSTEDGTAEMGGVTVQVVKGKRVGGDRVQPYYVGQVPGGVPQSEFWRAQFLDLPRFQPPPIKPGRMNGLPHMNMDVVLDSLIGDLL